VASPTGFGYLTAYAAGTTRPHASSINVTRGHTAANLAVVRLGSGGRVSIYNGSSGTVRLVADVEGYYGSGTPTAAGAFTSVAPSRIYDSVSLLPRTQNVTVQVGGRGGVPASGVVAAVLNITVASTTGHGYLTAYPFGSARPATSTMGIDDAQNRATAAVVALGTGGRISVYQGHSGHIRLIVDVVGYIRSGAVSQPGMFTTVPSARILDTQSGVGAPAGAVAPGGSVVLQVAGRGGVPASGVTSVTFTLTVTATTTSGYVTAYADAVRPGTSNLNFRQVEDVANLVLTPLRADGTVTLYNGSTGAVRLVADVAGYTT
jgi:hypothetical protein